MRMCPLSAAAVSVMRPPGGVNFTDDVPNRDGLRAESRREGKWFRLERRPDADVASDDEGERTPQNEQAAVSPTVFTPNEFAERSTRPRLRHRLLGNGDGGHAVGAAMDVPFGI